LRGDVIVQVVKQIRLRVIKKERDCAPDIVHDGCVIVSLSAEQTH
jgi:hypothetical protein